MTQLASSTPARPRWRSALATFALVSAMFAAGAALPANAEGIGTGPGVISGTVTNPIGLPIGVLVNVSVSSGQGTVFSSSVWTDSAGHYGFTDLAVGYTYRIQTSFFAYPTPAEQFVSLTADSPTGTANFAFTDYPAGIGTISGHVTLDGVPLTGETVNAWNFSTGQSASATTDANGNYVLTGLANGDWNISSLVPNTQPLNQWIATITDAAPVVTFNLAYLSWPVGTASISGTVTDSASGDGISGVQVALYGTDVAQQKSVFTDGNGAFSFDLLPAGSYTLSIWAFGYLPATQDVHMLDGQSVTANFPLVAANSTISGHITGPNGGPAEGVNVTASSPLSGGGGSVTDANGDYVIDGLGPIKYTVSLGGAGTPYDPQEKLVSAVANADVKVNFAVKARTTSLIAGGVFGPNGDWYSQPVCLTLYSSKSKKPLAEMVTVGEGFGDGTWSFDKVKPGSYTVEYRDCDDDPATKFDKAFLGGVKNYKDATFITVTAGQDSYENMVQLKFRK